MDRVDYGTRDDEPTGLDLLPPHPGPRPTPCACPHGQHDPACAWADPWAREAHPDNDEEPW
jgi:hypothetical protein